MAIAALVRVVGLAAAAAAGFATEVLAAVSVVSATEGPEVIADPESVLPATVVHAVEVCAALVEFQELPLRKSSVQRERPQQARGRHG